MAAFLLYWALLTPTLFLGLRYAKRGLYRHAMEQAEPEPPESFEVAHRRMRKEMLSKHDLSVAKILAKMR